MKTLAEMLASVSGPALHVERQEGLFHKLSVARNAAQKDFYSQLFALTRMYSVAEDAA